jgi:hypothetical protein
MVNNQIFALHDNWAAHPHLDSLKSIQLEFLSPSTALLVYQMDIGIAKKKN